MNAHFLSNEKMLVCSSILKKKTKTKKQVCTGVQQYRKTKTRQNPLKKLCYLIQSHPLTLVKNMTELVMERKLKLKT